MGWSIVDGFTSLAFLFLICCHVEELDCSSNSLSDLKIIIPTTHTTSDGDFLIKLHSSTLPSLIIQLFRLEENVVLSLVNLTIPPEKKRINSNITTLAIPCGYFSKGGKYYVLLRKNDERRFSTDSNPDEDDEDNSIITQTIDVRWSMPEMKIIPEHIQTYPKHPVIVTLEFPPVDCSPTDNRLESPIPEFWLELYYCGHSLSTCDTFNRRNDSFQILHAEQVRGFPGSQNITLRCEYFGLAGHYALLIWTTSSSSFPTHKAVYLKADWSEEFVFNVHAQSIFPCDRHNGGITVLFQYPECILLTGDRVRVFARNRAEVASLIPPTTLEYVAEQKVLRGSNKLSFDCDLFSEHSIEYCFVYVSQAITGAVADVRMNCVPTLPVRESKSGGWGPWSSWTPCSSTCIGGTTSRFRLCDSPVPRFGGKFCEGAAVETEKCGTDIGNIWECFDGNFDQFEQKVAETPTIKEEIGLYCRCGCVVHLGRSNPRRIIATSSQSCPGRIFWQIQADVGCIIQFKIEWFESSCGIQWLKIRDGMSLSSNLLADISDVFDNRATIVNSTGPTMLLEFFTDEYISNRQLCGGGFFAYARQLETVNISPFSIQRTAVAPSFYILKLTAVHSTAIFFLSGILIAMALLGAQYTFRYRKYHIAFTEEQDSTGDLTVGSATLVSRRSSTATLYSEVHSLRRISQQLPSDSQEKQTISNQENLDLSQASLHSSKSQNLENRSTSKNVSEESSGSSPTDNVESQQDMQRNIQNMSGMKESESTEDDETKKEITKEEITDSNLPAPAKGHYSSSRRLISRATIRNTIPKETKEKKNRERLLAGPSGSDFSISCTEVDLELDYYDYNVRNAGAAPGSYLGMDPAFLVYIPPLYGSGELSLEDEEEHPMENVSDRSNILAGDQYNLRKSENENLDKVSSKKEHENIEDANKYEYKRKSSEEETNFEHQPVIYESKYARMQLQDLSQSSDIKKSKMKIEEFAMIDSNILDEIRFVDDEDDEKH